MANVLVERFTTAPMQYLKESREDPSPFLAFFEGPAADYKNPTRNGRKYPRELWERIIQSDDFKEAMETRTCLGEANHPMDDRLDIDLEKVAIVLLSLELRDDGTVWAKFGILDTPNGNLLKKLLDSGCQIGVSSRGSGDVLDSSDGPVVESDTYYFVCFDAVVTPAVITARPTMTESVDPENHMSLTENIKIQIESAKSISDLDAIKSLVESLNLPEMDEIKSSIDIKSKDFQNGEDISSGLLKDLEESLATNEQLTKELNELKETLSAKDIRIERLGTIIEKFRASSKDLRTKLLDSKSENKNLSEELVSSATQCEELNDKLITERTKHMTDRRRYKKLSENMQSIQDRQEDVDQLQGDLSECQSKLRNAQSRIKVLESECKSTKQALTESRTSGSTNTKSLTEKCNSLQKKLNESTHAYLRLQSSKSGISESLIRNKLPQSYSYKDIDKAVSDILNQNDRMNKLSVSLNEGLGNHQVVGVDLPTSMSPEDVITSTILANVK